MKYSINTTYVIITRAYKIENNIQLNRDKTIINNNTFFFLTDGGPCFSQNVIYFKKAYKNIKLQKQVQVTLSYKCNSSFQLRHKFFI